jgi:hypothetical protein
MSSSADLAKERPLPTRGAFFIVGTLRRRLRQPQSLPASPERPGDAGQRITRRFRPAGFRFLEPRSGRHRQRGKGGGDNGGGRLRDAVPRGDGSITSRQAMGSSAGGILRRPTSAAHVAHDPNVMPADRSFHRDARGRSAPRARRRLFGHGSVPFGGGGGGASLQCVTARAVIHTRWFDGPVVLHWSQI